MSCLRRMLGVSRRVRIRKKDVKRNLNVRRDVIEKVEIRRLSYFGHVTSMKQGRLPYITMYGRVNGVRGRGRPRLDTVKKDCESRIDAGRGATRGARKIYVEDHTGDV